MSIEQLSIIIADFSMDMATPSRNSLRKIKSFRYDSYSLWAVDELYFYIVRNLYPRESGSLNEIIAITKKFITMVNGYALLNEKASDIFYPAGEVSEAFLDLLLSMV